MKDGFIDFVVIIVIAVLSLCLGIGKGLEWAKEDAIKAGAAHWTTNTNTGEAVFEWKGSK